MTDRSDEELMSRAAGGDAAAFEELLARHERRMGAFIGRMVGDRETARDLCQDVFLSVYSSRARYRAGEPFTAWLYRIARNACLNELERSRRAKALPLIEERDGAGTGDAAPRARPAARLLNGLVAEEESVRVERAVMSLEKGEREVALLRLFEGIPFREISRLTGTPEATVRLRFNRGVARVRRLLGGA